jgi:hypothetical protein
VTDYLSAEQVAKLLEPIHPGRVSHRDGQSHLEAYDVRAHLNRVFGFGRWSADLLTLDMLYEQATETKNGKPAFAVGYRATVRLTVCAPDGTVLATYTEAACGDGLMPDYKRADTHDFAVKTAESQALKRCAINLGDQFGLSLYRGGSTDAVVVKTWVMPDSAEDATDAPAFTEPAVVPEVAGGLTPEEQVAADDAKATGIRAAALADGVTPQQIAGLQLQAKNLRDHPVTGRLGGTTTLGEFLADCADALSKGRASA